MKTPVWVITGLLYSGKTTVINEMIENELAEQEVLVLQFESGEKPLVETEQVNTLEFTKNQLEQSPLGISHEIVSYLKHHSPDLVLVEWNGMEHFHKLEELFLQFYVNAILSIEKVVYISEASSLNILPAYGPAALSQIAGSDCAYIRSRGNAKEARVLYSYNPDIRIYTHGKRSRLIQNLFSFRVQPGFWGLAVAIAAMTYMTALVLLPGFGFPIGKYISIFLGVFLQAAPFLAVGVLISSAIQIYLPPDWIQKKFPKNVLAGQLFAIVAGFCLPVCDCASIPVFKGLVKKGVATPAAVTFMLVSPVINPVVILSTWFAFNGNGRMIAARCGLGILCAAVCGLSFLIKPPGDFLIEQGADTAAGCGEYDLMVRKDTRLSRFALMLRHAQNEFFAVGKFLIVGIVISTLFQNIIPSAVATGGGMASWAALLLMMALAFVLSLCSSSDAVVARSMAPSLPAGSILGFLVFGPMMDIKNVGMLLSGFRTKFVVRLFLTVFFVCFIGVGLFMLWGNGGLRL